MEKDVKKVILHFDLLNKYVNWIINYIVYIYKYIVHRLHTHHRMWKRESYIQVKSNGLGHIFSIP